MKHIFICLAILLAFIFAQNSFAVTYGPPGAKFTIDVPSGWTESLMDGGVQVTNGKSALVIQVVESGGMNPSAFGDAVVKNAGLSDVQSEVDRDLVNINAKKDGTPIQLIIGKLDNKFLVSCVLAGPDKDDIYKIIRSIKDADDTQLSAKDTTNNHKTPYEEFLEYEKAAIQGNSSAQNSLASCYQYGIGTSKDVNRAFYWYKIAAEQGNDEAQYNLGLCYFNGIGTSTDLNQAFYWYKRAAGKGNSEAQYNLGNHYERGIWISKDMNQALYWYKRAAEQNNAMAENSILRLKMNRQNTQSTTAYTSQQNTQSTTSYTPSQNTTDTQAYYQQHKQEKSFFDGVDPIKVIDTIFTIGKFFIDMRSGRPSTPSPTRRK